MFNIISKFGGNLRFLIFRSDFLSPIVWGFMFVPNCLGFMFWLFGLFGLMKVYEIWKVCIEARMLTIIARAHNSQSKIVLYLWGVFTFGMSIAGIRHVDSWGIAHPVGVSFFGMSIAGIRHVDSWSAVPLTIVYSIETSEHLVRNLLEGWREDQVGASCCQEAISWTKLLKHNYQDWDRQSPTQIVTEMCGFVTILAGTFLLHRTKDMIDGPAPLPVRLPRHTDEDEGIPLRQQETALRSM